jgi:hypothetical protein
MRWYIATRGQTLGPFEEVHVIEMARLGQVDSVRGETGGAWLPLLQSPFAGYASAVVTPFSNAQAAAPAVTSKPKKAPMQSRQWLLLLGGVFALWLSSSGWTGVLLGLGLVGWTIWSHRKGGRSLLARALKKPAGTGMMVGTVALAFVFLMCGISGIGQAQIAADQKKSQEEAEVARNKAEAEAHARKRAELEKALPAAIAKWKSRLDAAQTVKDPSQALQSINELRRELDGTQKEIGSPTPQPLSALSAAVEAVRSRIAPAAKLVDDVRTATANVASADGLFQQRDWIAADSAYESAETLLRELVGASESLRQAYVPASTNLDQKLALVTRARKSLVPLVAQARQKIEREEKKRKDEEEKQKAYAAVCGEKPAISPWDGEVIGLESTLKETANDPDSIDVEKCTDPVLTEKACWLVSCNVRGKNGFGALILLRKSYAYSKALGYQEVK